MRTIFFIPLKPFEMFCGALSPRGRKIPLPWGSDIMGFGLNCQNEECSLEVRNWRKKKI